MVSQENNAITGQLTWDKILSTSFLLRLKRPKREAKKKKKKKKKITSVSLAASVFFKNPLAVPAWLQVSSQTISREGARPAGRGSLRLSLHQRPLLVRCDTGSPGSRSPRRWVCVLDLGSDDFIDPDEGHFDCSSTCVRARHHA